MINHTLSVHFEKEFIKQAFEHYDSRGKPIDLHEFEEDFTRAKILCKIIKQSKNKKTFNIRLILNYFIIIFNCFDNFAVPLIFWFADEDIYPEIIAFIRYINRFPVDGTVNLNGHVINLNMITTDIRITELLRNEV